MDLSQITLTLREKIEPKLIYSPFLRLIIFSPWFLLSFAAVMLTLISGSLYLPKMWRVTPKGFEPIVRISGLDMTQNWALKRSARKFTASGDFEAAAAAWQGAVAQNPGDLSAVRASLENFGKLPRPENRWVHTAVWQMQWLLRINQTNIADVDLVAQACDRPGLYEVAAYFFAPLEKARLPKSAEAVLIKDLFHQNRIQEFYTRLERDSARLEDPEVSFYRLAYEAGWGESPASDKAFADLEKAVESSDQSDRIGHLLLRAAAQKQKIDLYARELDRLVRKNEARAGDHALYWTLLASTGRTNEAVQLAESSAVAADSAQGALRLAQSYLTLGLVDSARDLLKEMAPQYARAPELWMAYASVLEMKQDWDGLRAVARVIRQDVGAGETLWGYSYYLEGRADFEENRRAAAQDAFEKAAESTYEYPAVGLVVARELTRLNHPQRALRVFRTIESAQADNLASWDSLYNAALAAQDAGALLKATENAYRLFPKDLARLNNYAAALLVNHQRPEEAIKLTLQLHSKFPQSNAALINHGCALLLNGRSREALDLLEQVKVRELGSAERSQHNLTLFETYHALKMWPEARKAREAIVESALFPVQRERLREKEKQMPETLAEAA